MYETLATFPQPYNVNYPKISLISADIRMKICINITHTSTYYILSFPSPVFLFFPGDQISHCFKWLEATEVLEPLP
jgi:hypothetical protein